MSSRIPMSFFTYVHRYASHHPICGCKNTGMFYAENGNAMIVLADQVILLIEMAFAEDRLYVS